MSKKSVRLAKPNDAAAICNISRQVFNPPEVLQKSLVQKWVQEASRFVAVAEDESELVGYIVVQIAVSEADLISLAVQPGYQGQGWGQALMRYALQGLKKKDVQKLILEVRSSNHTAKAVYKKLGAEKTGERRGYYHTGKGSGTRENADVFVLNTVSP